MILPSSIKYLSTKRRQTCTYSIYYMPRYIEKSLDTNTIVFT